MYQNRGAVHYAFEPRPKRAQYLSDVLSGLKIPLFVESVALSHESGEANLRILTNDPGRSTIEEDNFVEELGHVEIVTVPKRRLIDYDFNEKIGCIKIDVEGHEESVLRGAERILIQDFPSLIIEIEEKHKPGTFKSVNSYLTDLGYNGFFYHNDQLFPMSLYDVEKHQNDDKKNTGEFYINNFIFLANNDISKIQHLIKSSMT